jgi:hypothetical protein
MGGIAGVKGMSAFDPYIRTERLYDQQPRHDSLFMALSPFPPPVVEIKDAAVRLVRKIRIAEE